jgi:hypothetical protein
MSCADLVPLATQPMPQLYQYFRIRLSHSLHEYTGVCENHFAAGGNSMPRRACPAAIDTRRVPGRWPVGAPRALPGARGIFAIVNPYSSNDNSLEGGGRIAGAGTDGDGVSCA